MPCHIIGILGLFEIIFWVLKAQVGGYITKTVPNLEQHAKEIVSYQVNPSFRCCLVDRDWMTISFIRVIISFPFHLFCKNWESLLHYCLEAVRRRRLYHTYYDHQKSSWFITFWWYTTIKKPSLMPVKWIAVLC